MRLNRKPKKVDPKRIPKKEILYSEKKGQSDWEGKFLAKKRTQGAPPFRTAVLVSGYKQYHIRDVP